MSIEDASKFSAADSTIGYLYQVRIALLWALRALPLGADFLISVETLDDVTFEEKNGKPKDLLQMKHHRNRKANLTDASPDLWKSLRIWLEAYHSGQVLNGTTLHLLTTAQAPSGSAASYLRLENRNEDAALTILEQVASTSENKVNEKAYELFRSTPKGAKRSVINHINILDCSPLITDLNLELHNVIFHAVERQHFDAFLERLEGWWFQRVLKQLMVPENRILAEELESQMSDLREQFKQESLPIDDDLLDFSLDEAYRKANKDSIFVRQIELTKAGERRIFAAVRDYYRAFEQRSRWMREDLILVGELSKYEKKLIEEWELVFEAMMDNCGKDATDETKERFARELLEWAEQVAPTSIRVRPQVTEPFVTRGSLHMLADKLKVGWHPEFSEHLSTLLKTKGIIT